MFLNMVKDTKEVTVYGINQPLSKCVGMNENIIALKVPSCNDSDCVDIHYQVWLINLSHDHGDEVSMECDKIIEWSE